MAVQRIAVTGGPGAGKTTLIAQLCAAHGGRLACVPEVATLMFRHVFPQVGSEHERRSVQRAIFAVQRNLEDVYAARLGPNQVLLCDRGTPDGAGYWPDGRDAFFAAMGTDATAELSRYDAVLFLQTAAAGGHAIGEGNEVRLEDLSTAMGIDQRLHDVWSRHGGFCFIGQEPSFADKLSRGLGAVDTWLCTPNR